MPTAWSDGKIIHWRDRELLAMKCRRTLRRRKRRARAAAMEDAPDA